MAKTKDNKKVIPEGVEAKTGGETEAAVQKESVKAVPENVEKLMRLYPQYDEIYVTPNGFVHPKNAPKYVIKDAALYKNKYYKP